MGQSKLEIIIEAIDKFTGVFTGIGKTLGGFGKILGGLAITAAGAGITALGGALVISIKEAMEAQEVQAQLAAVLKSTGGVAGMTADQVNALAEQLMGVTRFSDETIISAESLLLTFTRIGSDIFPDATKAVLDMSTAMGQDWKTSALQIGKALNDPIAGLTALRRVGVQFTDAQAEMIKKLVESGDLLGAQKLILQELNREFGGSAVAAGQTLPGQLDILRNSLLNVAESVGTTLLPILTQSLQAATPYILQFAQAFGAFLQSEKFQAFLTGVGNFIATQLIPSIANLATWLQTNIPLAIAAVSNWWTNTLMPAIREFQTYWVTTLQPALSELWTWLITNLPPAIASLKETWATIQPVIETWTTWVRENLFPVLQTIWDWFATNLPPAIQAISSFWETYLKPAFDAFVGFQQTYTIPLLQTIYDWWKVKIPEAIRTVKAWINGLVLTFNRIRDSIQLAINKVSDFFGSLKNAPASLIASLLMGNSPSPFELSLLGINEQMGLLAGTTVPQLVRALGSLGGSAMTTTPMAGLGAGLTSGMTALPGAGVGMAGGAGGLTVVYSPVFSAASMHEFETQLVPLIDRQLTLNQRRRV